MSTLSKDQADAEINQLVSSAYASLELARSLADEYKLSFSFNPAYGMGGTYYGDPEADWLGLDEPGWVSSSQDC